MSVLLWRLDALSVGIAWLLPSSMVIEVYMGMVSEQYGQHALHFGYAGAGQSRALAGMGHHGVQAGRSGGRQVSVQARAGGEPALAVPAPGMGDLGGRAGEAVLCEEAAAARS